MLVLSRKVGEEIVLPNCGVTIGVVAVNGSKVRLGIAAPPETSVHRKEVWQRIRESRESGHYLHRAECEALRVLIADADQALSLSYQESLGARGFNVDTVTNGLECVSHLRKCPPHVLVLDPSILWGGGEGVIALMREESKVPAVPVLVHVSPDNGAASADLAFAVSARAFKPLAPEEMASMVRQLANRSGNRQEGPNANDGGTDWQHEMRRKIAARTHGHVRGLEVEVIDGRLIVHGQSPSYYGRQLAYAAALELMKTPDSAPFTEIQMDVEVLQSR